MSNEQVARIMEKLGELHGDIRGINQRLDTLNGSVAKVKTEIVDLKVEDAKIAGEIEAINNYIEEERTEQKGKNNRWMDLVFDIGKTILISALSVLGILNLTK